MSKLSTGLRLILLCITTAFFDCFVRLTDAKWVEFGLFQLLVTLSPIVYLVAMMYGLSKLKHLPLKLTPKHRTYLAIALIIYAAFILIQIFTRGISVGSAFYSIVSPMFASGIPIAAMTYALFFSKTRKNFSSIFMLFVCLMWVLGPICADAMYLVQGGYRGNTPAIDDIPVIGTSYQFIIYTIVLILILLFMLQQGGVVFLVIWLLALAIAKKNGHSINIKQTISNFFKLPTIALYVSMMTFTIHLILWADFMSD